MNDTLHLAVAVPPSVNAMYSNVPGKGRLKTKDYRAWAREAEWAIAANKEWRADKRAFGPGFKVTLFLPMNMRGDIDNRLKPILDLLVRMRVTVDDKHAAEVKAVKATWRDPQAVIEIVGTRS